MEVSSTTFRKHWLKLAPKFQHKQIENGLMHNVESTNTPLLSESGCGSLFKVQSSSEIESDINSRRQDPKKLLQALNSFSYETPCILKNPRLDFLEFFKIGT